MKSDASGDSNAGTMVRERMEWVAQSQGGTHEKKNTKTVNTTDTTMMRSDVFHEPHTQEQIAKNPASIYDDPAISRLYMSIEDAREEIWKRWNNEDLKKEVEKFLGNDVPEVFQGKPRAVLARHIASPNQEEIHFLRIAQQSNLSPLFLEYLSDRFVSRNFDKYYLGKLLFYEEGEDHVTNIVTSKDIVDIAMAEGQSISSIKTIWGERLVEFHHRLFQEIAPRNHDNSADISSWYATHGGCAKLYYPQYLSLFICHGILAELFLLYTKEDKRFFENVVMPAIETLESKFGVLPLITQVTPPESGANLSWKYYPESMKKMMFDRALECL